MAKAVIYAILSTFALVEILETFVYKYIILDKGIDVVKAFFARKFGKKA